jgi:hypothetical protein
MTAEIAVANSSGIALAADSAVTISGPLGEKIYNTVNKLFRPTDIAPVGAMVFNAASYGAIPWETLFKDYREQYGDQRFSTLEEHAVDFIDYLSEIPEPIDGPMAIVHELMYVYKVLVNQLDRWAENEFATRKTDSIDSRRVAKKLVELAEAILDQQKTASIFEGLTTRTRFPSLRTSEFDDLIRQVAHRFFAKDILSSMFLSLSLDIAIEIARRGSSSGAKTGVVVAGYGVDEMLPSIVSFDIHTPIDGRLRRRPMNVTRLEPDDAIIAPYAQIDFVQTYMDGIHPELKEFIDNRTESTIQEVANIILDAAAEKLPLEEKRRLEGAIEGGIADLVISLGNETKHWQEEHISGPTVEAVRHLPLSELAGLAESMVTTTALRRRVSLGPETVGGAVDVAVISKGDGLIWINRKHYFDARLNSHYFVRQRALSGREAVDE